MKYVVLKEYDNKTVKEFITKHAKLSAKLLTKIKKLDDGIMLNGKRVTVRAILHEGDTLVLNIEQEEKTSDSIAPINIPLDIIYEDEHFIAVNKKAGMPTHPSHDHHDDTLANGLAFLYKQRNQPFVFRAVNRLDKDTSGIVIFAKSSVSASAFSNIQQKKLTKKRYIAIVAGTLKGQGSIEGYIRRKDNSVMLREFSPVKTKDDSQYSHTDYNVLSTNNGLSLVELYLHTGRTHQIRVHMASIAHPVLGDGLYGTEDTYSRHYLHASSISFPHPITEKQIYIKCDLPDDFKKILKENNINYDQI